VNPSKQETTQIPLKTKQEFEKKSIQEPEPVSGKISCPELEQKGFSCYFFYSGFQEPTPEFIKLLENSSEKKW
jgi:hypothetical protein